VASDASWELGRFLLLMMPAAAGDEQHRHRYCLLTASGRKFVTLMQEVVDGVACPLQSLGLGMDGNAAQLVADLFREYVRSILDLLLLEEEEEELVIAVHAAALRAGQLLHLGVPAPDHGADSVSVETSGQPDQRSGRAGVELLLPAIHTRHHGNGGGGITVSRNTSSSSSTTTTTTREE